MDKRNIFVLGDIVLDHTIFVVMNDQELLGIIKQQTYLLEDKRKRKRRWWLFGR